MIIFKSMEINNDKHKQNNNINNDYQDHDHDDDHGDAVMVHSLGSGGMGSRQFQQPVASVNQSLVTNYSYHKSIL